MSKKQTSRKIQIGVMGSAADLKYSDTLESLAFAVGVEVANADATLVYGAEKDYDSLSTAAARGAMSEGGLAVGITYGKGLEVWGDATVVIATGLERGGGREFTLALSCDALIAISGGSGALTEMVVAYQANVPIIVLEGSGGWSDKMSDKYFDARERVKVLPAKDAKNAVEIALKEAKSNLDL